jgi:hypothetical protein
LRKDTEDRAEGTEDKRDALLAAMSADEPASKPGVMLYFSALLPALTELDDAELGKLFRAILEYSAFAVLPDELPPMVRVFFAMLRPELDRDDTRYYKRILDGRYGGLVKKHPEELKGTDCKSWCRENNITVEYFKGWCIRQSRARETPGIPQGTPGLPVGIQEVSQGTSTDPISISVPVSVNYLSGEYTGPNDADPDSEFERKRQEKLAAFRGALGE